MRWRTWLIATAIVATLAAAVGCASARVPAKASSTRTHAALGVHVAGRHLENSRGRRVRLVGFNNSGAEYACIEGWGIFDTGNGANTSVPAGEVDAMARWRGANAVRVPLNEQCWLGIGGVKPQYGGAAYRTAIRQYVGQLTSRGFAVILDLHRSAPGNEASNNQEPMPDAHSIAFWAGVARMFKSNRAVLFDLFNEPWPDTQSTSRAAWRCWRSGGCVQPSTNGRSSYRAVGMDQLIAAVRRAGAHNVVMAGGVDYAGALNHWLAYRPHDPAHQLAAAIHIYSFNGCTTERCFNRAPAHVARHVPLVIGELGPDLLAGWSPSLNSSCPSSLDGTTRFDSTLLAWARRHGASWTAWTWNPWGNCWALVKDFAGHPTAPYGVTIKRELSTHPSAHRV